MRLIVCASLSLLATSVASAQTPAANRWTSDKYDFSLTLPPGWSEEKALSAQAPLGNTLRSAPPGAKISSGAICAIDRKPMGAPLAKSQADLNQSWTPFTVENWSALLTKALQSEYSDVQTLPSAIINGVYTQQSTAKFNKGKGVIRSIIYQTPQAAYWFYCVYAPEAGKAGAARTDLLRSQIEDAFKSAAIVEPPIKFPEGTTTATAWTSDQYALSLTLPAGWREDKSKPPLPETSSFVATAPDDPSKFGAACMFNRIALNLPPDAPKITQEGVNSSDKAPYPVAKWEAILRKVGAKELSDVAPTPATIINGVFATHTTAKIDGADSRFTIFITPAALYQVICKPISGDEPRLKAYRDDIESILNSVFIGAPRP